VRKPYPLPKIDDIIQQLQGFKFATSLVLNMGYYHINLSLDAQKICTITTPFGKDIFQEEISYLFYDIEYAKTYLDDLIALKKGSFSDHILKLKVFYSVGKC